MPFDADFHFHLTEAIQPKLQGGETQLAPLRRGDRAAVTHPVFLFAQIRSQHSRDVAQRLTEETPESVEQSQFNGTTSSIRSASAFILWDFGEAQLLDAMHGLGKLHNIRQLPDQVAFLEQGEARVDGLAGHVVARNAFAEAHGAIGESTANNQVIGGAARVRGVLNYLPQGNPHMPSCQSSDPHQLSLEITIPKSI